MSQCADAKIQRSRPHDQAGQSMHGFGLANVSDMQITLTNHAASKTVSSGVLLNWELGAKK